MNTATLSRRARISPALTMLTLVSLSSASLAERETLFNDIVSDNAGGYGGPVIKYEAVDDQQAILLGGEGAGWWGYGDHAYSVGGGGYGTVQGVDLEIDRSLYFGYGGLTLGYRYRPYQLVHFDTRLMLGGGDLKLRDSDGVDIATDEFVMAELTLGGEVNLNRFFSLGLGVYQRVTSELNASDLDQDALNNVGAALTFRLGRP